jgi:hypothetical protein
MSTDRFKCAIKVMTFFIRIKCQVNGMVMSTLLNDCGVSLCLYILITCVVCTCRQIQDGRSIVLLSSYVKVQKYSNRYVPQKPLNLQKTCSGLMMCVFILVYVCLKHFV